MKTRSVPILIGLLIAALLGACTLPSRALPQPETTPLESAPTSTHVPSPPTATPTELTPPISTPTYLPAALPLCPPTSAEVSWECRESSSGATRTCSPPSPSEADWRCYEDLDFGFALNLPSDMIASIAINTSSSDVATIQRRHTLIHPSMGGIDLDIWITSEPTLAAWLEQMNQVTSPELFPLQEPNATIGDRPAVIYITGPDSPETMLTVVFRDGIHVYRLWHTMFCSTDTLEIVRQMIDSLRFSPDPVPAELPEDIWQQAVRICSQE